MRLPWISPRSSSRGRTRRKRPAPLRVRRLERRRVLDAAVTELVLSPTDLDGATEIHDTNEGTQVNTSATATGFGDLFYEWTLRKDGAIVAKGFDTTYNFTPQDNGNYSITLAVTDSTQSTATRTEQILVHNVRPVLVVAADQSVDEGSPLDLSALSASPLGLFVDPGLLDTHTATVNWGDGSATEAPTIFTAMGAGTLGGSHTYASDGVYEVVVTVTDDDGGSDSKSFFVTVNNVAPTATLTNSGPVDEGSSATVSFSNQFDPGADDNGPGFRYAYDLDNNGTFDIGDGTYGGSVASDSQMVSAAVLADGPGTRTIKARIIDQDGGFTDYMTDITVNNVAPTLNNIVVTDSTIDEGDTAKITLNVNDPGAMDVFAVDVDWQDGSGVNTITGLGLTDAAGVVGSTKYSWDAQSRELTVQHLYLDDDPTATSSDTYAVALAVRDDDLGSSAPYQVDITVANVRPVLTTAADQIVDEGALLDLSAIGAPPLALFADPGILDSHTATVDWGDGTPLDGPTIYSVNGAGTLGSTHIYENSGVYTVTVTVTDDDGGVDTQQFQVTVNNVAPTLVNIVAEDASINEGESATISMNIEDPSPLDTFEVDVDWRDGGSVDTITGLGASDTSGTVGDTSYVWAAATRQLTVTHLYVDDDPSGTASDVVGVLLAVRDNDGDQSDIYTVDITVNNVRPVLIVAADQSVDEGSPLALTGFGSPSLALFIDAGVADTHTATVNWGDGSGDQAATLTGGAGSFAVGASHTYLDNGVYTVTVTVTDDDGGVDTAEFMVTVANVDPELINIVVDDATINEGQTATITATIDDPGADAFEVDVDWKDNGPIDTITGLGNIDSSGTVGSTSYQWDADTRQLTVSHLFVDDNPTGTASDLYTVVLAVRDDDGGASGPYNAGITVSNVRPVLVAAGDQTVNEGSLLDLSGIGAPPLALFIDAGIADTHTVTVNWGDGTGDQAIVPIGGSGSFAVGGTHTYVDDGLYTVTVTVTDDDGGTDIQMFQVTVQNVAPTLENVAATDATINEGQTAEIVATINDPGALDTFSVDVNWKDNGPVDTITGLGASDISGVVGSTSYSWDADTQQLTVRHLYQDDNPSGTASDLYAVELVVRDDDLAATGPYTVNITVSNVRPVLVVAQDQTVNEGSVLDLSAVGAPPLGLFIDNGKVDTHTATVNWGDGTTIESPTVFFVNGSGALGASHTYADNGVYTVTVTVTDDDGGFDTKSFLVTVQNVAPTLVVTPGAALVDEGSLFDFDATFSDPGFDNPLNPGAEKQESFTYDVDWGDGRDAIVGQSVVDTNGMPGVPSSGAFGGSHIYADNGTYTVKVTIHDDDGGSDVQTFMVTVNNVAPIVVTPNGNQAVNEGTLLSLANLATFTDPGFDNPDNPGAEKSETFTYDIDWGDGRDPINGASIADISGGPGVPSSGTIAGSHTYADDGLYTVKVTVHDDDGGSQTMMFDVTVSNVAPTLAVTPSITAINEGQTVNFNANFSDPGFDNPDNPGAEKQESFTYDVDWGDGRNAVNGQAVADTNGSPGIDSTGNFTGSHVYADDGTYTVKVTIHDDNGDMHEQTFVVVVTNVAPSLTGTTGLVVNEGALVTLGGLGVGLTDPGFDNPNNPTTPPQGDPFHESFVGYTINWGDGTTPDQLTVGMPVSDVIDGPTTAPFTHLNQLLMRTDHVYADNGNYTVTIRVADDNMGAFANAALFQTGTAGVDFVDLTFVIQVNNVAPTVMLPNGNLPGVGQPPIFESQTIPLTNLGVITDPGFNGANGSTELFNYLVDWNDDGTFETSSRGPVTIDDVGGVLDLTDGSFDGSHTFADNGTYTVRVRVADDDMGAYSNADLFISGVAGVDYVEVTFTIVVNNVAPTLNQFPGGKKLQGDDINTDGVTTIRMNLHDPGFDNAQNQVNAANGGENYETFTYIVEWGDGMVDAVHLYTTNGLFTVTVTMDGVQTFSTNNFNGNPLSVLTLVSEQDNLYDASVAAKLRTFTINWGDGTTDTVQLLVKDIAMINAPGAPTLGNGQTTVVGTPRVSGNVNVETVSAGEIRHMYAGPPDPLHPTADVPIRLTVVDDDGGRDGGFNDANAVILVSNPGIETVNVAIDTTPDVARLDLTVRPMTDVFLADASGITQLTQVPDVRGGGGEVAATTERYLELRVVYPDGTESEGFKIKDEALLDLRKFFATLPDGRYAIYLVRTENNSSRLVIEVDVRRGRVIDVSDDSEGTRDRPPTGEEEATEAVPLDQNPLLERVPAEAADATSTSTSGEAATPTPILVIRKEETAEKAEPADDRVSPATALLVPMSAAALAVEPWSRRVDSALAQADENAWRRLRRAGRSGRAARLPFFSKLRSAATLDYNSKN